MKKVFFFLSFVFCAISAQAQGKAAPTAQPNPKQELILAEAACGQCKFDLTGHGCDLAIRINGKAYFVKGTSIDSHGDAHAADGFCQAIRQAQVQGQVVGNQFQVTYFKLLPAAPSAKPKN